MASLPKAIEDLKGCIHALKEEHDEGHITDNSTELHKFCVKLEYVLQIDMKVRVGMWGGKKDYWDYFCSCLDKIKGLNDGIRFVKGMKEVKTSLGKGRAFIRYSLVHHRLGDTLQQCVSNEETTRQWYNESSILCKPSAFAALTDDLYDLNDIQFDLAPSGHELDTAWPTFARSAIGVGLYLWNPPTRSTSMASINSQPSQSDSRGLESMTEVDSAILDNQLEKLNRELEECEKYNRDLRHQLQTAQSELDENRSLALENEARLSAEIGELQRKNQELVFKSDQAVTDLESAKKAEESAKQELESAAKEHQRITSDFGERLEALKLQLSSETAMRQKHEGEQRTECLEYQKQLAEMDVKHQGYEMELVNLKEVEARLRANLNEAETKNKGLEERIDKLTNTIDSSLTTRSEQLSQEFQSITLLRSIFAQLSSIQSDNSELNSIKTEFYSKLEALIGVEKRVYGSSPTGELDVSALDRALSQLEVGITESQQGLQEVKSDVGDVQTSAGTSSEKTESNTALEDQIKSLSAEMEEWKLTAEQQRNLVLDRDMRLKEKTNQLHQLLSEMKTVKESTASILETSCLMLQSLPEPATQSTLPRFYSLNNYSDSSITYGEVLRTLPEVMREVEGRVSDMLVQRGAVEADLVEARGAWENLQNELASSVSVREEMSQQLSSLQERHKQAEVAQVETQGRFQSMEEELNSLRAEVICKEDAINELKIIGEKVQNDSREEILSLQTSLQESNDVAEELKLKCQNYEEEVKLLNSVTEKLESEKLLELQLKANMEEQTIKLEKELALKSSQMEEIQSAIVRPNKNLGDQENKAEETPLKTVTEVMKEHEDKVEFMTEQFKLLKTDLESITVEKEQLGKKIESLEKGMEEERTKCKQAETDRNEYEKKYDALSEEYKVLTGKYDSVSSQFICTKATLEKLSEESQTDKDKLQANEETIRKLDDTLDCARETAKEYQIRINEQTEQLQEKQKAIDELEAKLQATEEECKNAKDVMEREVSAIEFQRSTEAMQYQDKLEAFEKLHLELSQWKERSLELEESLTNMTEEMDKAKENEVNAANKHQSMVKENEELCAKYQQDAQILENSLVQISNQLEEKARRVIDLEEKVKLMQENGASEIDLLKEKLEQKEKDNDELMVQIVKFGKDKDVIWQRLQKLETQRKAKALERWMEDKDVPQCIECETNFSLTVRRHHCRVCGGIYCSKCTDFSILTAQSKKRVRVCEKCFVLHNHSLEATAADTSAIVDDDAEENVTAFKESRLSISTSSLSDPMTSSSTLETGEIGQGEACQDERSDTVSPTTADETDTSIGGDKHVDANTTKVSFSDGDGDFEVITDDDVTEVRQEQDATEPAETEKPEHSRYQPITSQEIQMNEGEQRELYLPAGTAQLVPIIIEEEGVMLCWEFTSEPKSIAVKVSFAESLEDEVKEEIVPLQRFNSHQQSASGELLTYKSGVYILQFDNTFSRMTAKTVTYQLYIKQPDVSY